MYVRVGGQKMWLWREMEWPEIKAEPTPADQEWRQLAVLATICGSAGIAGTFNAAVAGLLGRAGDDPGERTADAVESMDEKLTDIRDDLRGRPALAFDS